MATREPGLYLDVPEADYHGDPDSLSHSGAKVLLDSPARFQWRRQHPEHKAAFDLGTLAHALILRSGDNRIRVIDAADYKGGAARTARDEAYATGLVPVLRKDLLAASKMAREVRRHPLAGPILARPGPSEASAYGIDPETGVTLRARFDRLTDTIDGRPVIVDVKTTSTTGPDAFRRKAFDYGYHTGADWYRNVATLAGVTDEPPMFLLVAVETAEPHFVHVHAFDADSLDIAAQRNRRAIDLYAQCVANGQWPEYDPNVNVLTPPRYLTA